MHNKMTKGLLLSFVFLAVLFGSFFLIHRDRANSLPSHDDLAGRAGRLFSACTQS